MSATVQLIPVRGSATINVFVNSADGIGFALRGNVNKEQAVALRNALTDMLEMRELAQAWAE